METHGGAERRLFAQFFEEMPCRLGQRSDSVADVLSPSVTVGPTSLLCGEGILMLGATVGALPAADSGKRLVYSGAVLEVYLPILNLN